MNYNVKTKLEKIQELEENQKTKDLLNKASLQENRESAPKLEKSSKKNFTFSLNEALLRDVEEFLNEFGDRGESKSSFLEESLRFYLKNRKKLEEQKLEAKIKKIKALQQKD